MKYDSFQVIPAVDLLGTDAVRLERGDYERVTLRESDPAALVRRFADAGAELIHVVDLDGARLGQLRPQLIRELVDAARPARVQASGGIRSEADARALLDAGAERVIVGTAAFADEGALPRFAAALGEALVVAVDCRDGRIAVHGWGESAGIGIDEALDRCVAAGVSRLHCTAIDRDGTLAGPDLPLLRHVVERSGLRVVAAGGVSVEADLDAIAATGCEGAVVGRALLEGRVPLSAVGRR
jgi:phosphoribosylformimino-5-aminoimidazole carboxamide ribotide isomerase